MHNDELQQSRWCAISSVIRSGRVVQALPIQLFLRGQFVKAVVLVRPTTVEFAMLDCNTVIDWFEVPTFSRVLAATVIPTQHERSDLLCLLTDNFEYFMVRVASNKTIQVEVRRKLERHGAGTDERCFMGTDYSFNVRDTEGYLFIAVGATITTIGFAEKRDGLRLNQTSTSALQLDELVHVGIINQSHSKYKNQTLGLIVESEGKTTFRMVNVTPIRLLENPSINKHNLIHFYSGRELVLLTGRELFLYNYQSTKPIMTHRLPLLECGNQVLFLQQVYGLVGESLILFNNEGLKDYGQIDGKGACHIGENKLVVWHTDEDTRLLELDDHDCRETYRWLNLTEIYSVECLDDCGLETYVMVSPNKNNQLTLLKKALKTQPLGNVQLEEPVSCMYRVSQHSEQYLLLGLTDQNTLLLRLTQRGLEELWSIDMKLVCAAGNYVVFSNGVYRMDYPQHKMELILEAKIELAACYESELAYCTTNELVVYNLAERKELNNIFLVAPLIALCYTDGYLCYSEWNSKQVQIQQGKHGEVLQLSYQPRSVEMLEGHLFIGSAGGQLQIFDIRNIPTKKEKFCCGSLPTKVLRLGQTVYCLSSSVIAVNIKDSISKSTVALRDVSNIQLGLTSEILIVSCFKQLTIYRICTSEQINSRSFKVCDGNVEVPHVRIFNKMVHVFKSKELLLIDPHKYEQRTIAHELEAISCVMVCSEGVLVAGTIGNGKYLSYFRQGKQLIRQISKRLPTLLKWLPTGRVTIVYQSDLKVIWLDQENIKITDLANIELSVKCSSITASHHLNKLLVADPFKYLMLLDCKLDGNMPVKATTVATANCTRLCNDVAFLDDLIVIGDKNGGVLAMLPWLNAPNDLEKMGLYVVGSCNLSEQAWTLTEEHRHSLLYGTAEGSIGRLRIIDKVTFDTLKRVEQLAKKVLPFLTEDYFTNKPKTHLRQQNCMVDCQPLTAFLTLPQSRSLLNQHSLSFDQIVRMVEAISHPPTIPIS